MTELSLACPVCGAPAAANRTCACGFTLCLHDGILRALLPDRREHYARFLREYASIRHAEGRGSHDPAYYRALPFEDLTGKNSGQWKIRGATYRYFQRRFLPAEPTRILDIGAGNGWLSARLAARGHSPVAVDILTDELDGLGAARTHTDIPLVEAEFDRLPFTSGQFGMVIFNASLHYSTDYQVTLAEALRCLAPGGRVMVLDSPLYRCREHGEMMRAERAAQFQAQYGFPSDGQASIEYFHTAQLAELARDLQIIWHLHQPWYGWQWHLRPWRARLQGKRPPSRFCIFEGEPVSA